MKAPSGFSSLGIALKNRNYRIYTMGSTISLIGTWMQRMAVGWLTWELTHSGTWLGAMAFADLFPMVIVTPLAGSLVDRSNRLRVSQVSQLLMLLQSLVLFGVVAAGAMTIWILLGLTLLLGAISAVNQPARLSLIPALVERSDLNAAVRLNSIIFNLARFIGPLIAGLVIVSFGVTVAFIMNAASTALFLVTLSFVKVNLPKALTQQAGNVFAHFAEGLRYTVTHPGLRSVFIILIAVAIGGRPIMELMPGIAAEMFNSGADGLSALTAAIGIGAIVGGLFVGNDSSPQALGRLLTFSSLTLAVSLLVFAFTDQLWIGLAILSVAGFGLARSGIASQTVIQLSVEESKRGRVLSLYGVIFKGVPAIGALVMGFASELFGLRASIICGSSIIILLCLWSYLRARHLAKKS